LIAIAAFWIAAQAAGFNFWTVVLGYGILSLVAANAFGQTLRDMGAFFLIALTDKIEDDWYIDVMGTGAQGRVDAIHMLWVELSVRDAEKNLIKVFVPTSVIMSNIVRRILKLEAATDALDGQPPITTKQKPPLSAQIMGSRIRPVGLVDI
jgi:small-conductance mechanosensitive channel